MSNTTLRMISTYRFTAIHSIRMKTVGSVGVQTGIWARHVRHQCVPIIHANMEALVWNSLEVDTSACVH